MRRKTKKEISCGPWNLKGAMRSDRMLILGLVIIIVVSVAVCGKVLFSWKKQWMGHKKWSQGNETQNLQAQINALRKQVNQLKAEKEGTDSTQEKSAVVQIGAAFEKAVNGKDFAKIETLMAARVYYVVDQSDCCGDITKKEAAANLKNYISSAKSFNFDQNQQVVKKMKVNLADTFAKYTIGIADNRMVLSYHLNSQGKVDDLMLSASHLMYDLE